MTSISAIRLGFTVFMLSDAKLPLGIITMYFYIVIHVIMLKTSATCSTRSEERRVGK